MGPAVGLAALAALCNATGDLLQRGAARHEPSDPRRSVGLIARLLARPRWVAGVLVSLLGLLVHVGALSVGELAVVQPVLVLELPLAVVGSAWLFGRRPAARDWAAVAALGLGLVLFVGFLGPTGGQRLDVPFPAWAGATAVVAALMVGLTVRGWRARRDVRGALLGTASGMGYGMAGAYFAAAAEAAGTGGVVGLASAWQTWAAVVVALLSFYLLQNALTAGQLVAVGPGLILANPVVAVVWGLVVFGETARGGFALLGTAAGVVLLVAGVVLLGRSPLLDSGSGTRDPAGGAVGRSRRRGGGRVEADVAVRRADRTERGEAHRAGG